MRIVATVEKDSPDRAAKLAARLLTAPDHLVHSPRMGRRVPEFGLDYVRELVFVRPYRIIYVVREQACHIVSVLHSRRNIKKLIRVEDFDDL